MVAVRVVGTSRPLLKSLAMQIYPCNGRSFALG
jgi:hypothetical protein